jgi:MoaA/NifB/PqqE/SkfB family radical SAM enzyme
MMLKANDTIQICKAPWSLLTVDPSGYITLCCHSSGFPLAHINQVDSLRDFFNSNIYENIRKEFRSGCFPSNCQVCSSAKEIPPMKQNFIQSLPWSDDQLDNNPKKILALEYTASNLCNQTCATCGSRFSSKWLRYDRQAKEEGLSFRQDSIYVDLDQEESSSNTKNLSKVLEVLPNLKLLIFKGGEPLADPKTRIIMEEIVSKQLKCSILIVSNLSLIDEKWLELFRETQQNSKIIMVGSVDGTNEVYEWIRGSRWQDTKETILNYKHKLGEPLQINISVSLFNLFTLPADLKLIEQMDATRNVRFTIVTDPWYTSAHLLTLQQRQRQLEKILNTVDSCTGLTFLNTPVLQDLLSKQETQRDPKQAMAWIQFLNSMRKSDILEMVPDLRAALNECNTVS